MTVEAAGRLRQWLVLGVTARGMASMTPGWTGATDARPLGLAVADCSGAAEHTRDAQSDRASRRRLPRFDGGPAASGCWPHGAAHGPGDLPLVVGRGGGTSYSVPIQTLLFFTALSFLPAVLLLMTGFTRIVIVLSLLRRALGTQAAPPNQVILGLSLF